VEFLRGEKIVLKRRLEKLLDENRATGSGIVLAELLIGISNEKDQRFLEECFLGLPWLEKWDLRCEKRGSPYLSPTCWSPPWPKRIL
jgi:hypothetical protein